LLGNATVIDAVRPLFEDAHNAAVLAKLAADSYESVLSPQLTQLMQPVAGAMQLAKKVGATLIEKGVAIWHDPAKAVALAEQGNALTREIANLALILTNRSWSRGFGSILRSPNAAMWWVIQVVQTNGDDLSGWHLAPPLALGGFGLGLLVVPLVDVALATVDPADAGAASGAYGTLQQCGAAVGVAVVGVVFFHVVGTVFTPARMADALGAAGWVSVVGFAVCALATLFLPARAAVRAHAEREQALV